MLSQLGSQDDIEARLRTLAEPENVDVAVGEYLGDSFKPEVDENGLFKPYILLSFIGSFPTYESGIVSPRQDTERATFGVYVVSPGDRISRELRDKIRELLIGYEPVDSGHIRATAGYSFVDTELGYHRYAYNISFAYITNLSN